MSKYLSRDETTRLIKLESKISRNKEAFDDTLKALIEIKTDRLYRSQFDTFKEYAEQRWGYSESYLNRLITHAEILEQITPIGVNESQLPNESQARELAKVESEKRAEVWQETVEATGGKPTAKAVKEAVEKRAGKGSGNTTAANAAKARDVANEAKAKIATPNESSLEVNTLKELIENEQEKLTVFRWLWESMLPFQRAKLPELIELWSQ